MLCYLTFIALSRMDLECSEWLFDPFVLLAYVVLYARNLHVDMFHYTIYFIVTF